MKAIYLTILFFSFQVMANNNSCKYARDGVCDDGGPGSKYSICELGTDKADCGRRGDRNSSGQNLGQELKQCELDLNELQSVYDQDISRLEDRNSDLLSQIRRMEDQLRDRSDRERLACSGANMYGKYAKGGGCNIYGCFYPGGGCNIYGCFYEGGFCDINACIKKAPSVKKACND